MQEIIKVNTTVLMLYYIFVDSHFLSETTTKYLTAFKCLVRAEQMFVALF